MAGDWIKMRCNLSTHPKVVKLASRLSVTRVTVIGALHAVWTVADQHASDDGVLEMDAESLDAFTETPGFCRALEAVGWLEVWDECVKFPEYQEHNGTTGKSRASAQKRQRKSRSTVTHVTVDRDQRREEKRREEIEPPSVVCSEQSQATDSKPSSNSKADLSEFTFPTQGKGGSSWTLPMAKLTEYREAYHGLDVDGELVKARQWCRDNAAQRKTSGGMSAFLTRWLNKATNGASNAKPSRHVGASPARVRTRDYSNLQILGEEN